MGSESGSLGEQWGCWRRCWGFSAVEPRSLPRFWGVGLRWALTWVPGPAWACDSRCLVRAAAGVSQGTAYPGNFINPGTIRRTGTVLLRYLISASGKSARKSTKGSRALHVTRQWSEFRPICLTSFSLWHHLSLHNLCVDTFSYIFRRIPTFVCIL